MKSAFFTLPISSARCAKPAFKMLGPTLTMTITCSKAYLCPIEPFRRDGTTYRVQPPPSGGYGLAGNRTPSLRVANAASYHSTTSPRAFYKSPAKRCHSHEWHGLFTKGLRPCLPLGDEAPKTKSSGKCPVHCTGLARPFGLASGQPLPRLQDN